MAGSCRPQEQLYRASLALTAAEQEALVEATARRAAEEEGHALQAALAELKQRHEAAVADKWRLTQQLQLAQARRGRRPTEEGDRLALSCGRSVCDFFCKG